MFGPKKKNDTINTSMINTIIGNNSKIEGVLTASESTRIDGVLEGKIVSESSVIIGENGIVRGDITAVEILVAGVVYGNLVAKERIEMTSTGHILGDLITKTLVIDEGASFKGNCTMDVAPDTKAESPVHTAQPNTRELKPEDKPGEKPGERPGKNKKSDPEKEKENHI